MEGLWNRASKQIRTVDNDTLIWFEGVTTDVLSGFNNVPLGDGSKTVQSFHYYNPPQLGSISDTLYNRRKDSIRLKTAAVMTEFTFWMGDAKQMQSITDAVTAADANMVSWMGWAYENLYDGSTGKPHPELAGHYSRAYPSAVSGEPKSFGYDESSATFRLQFVTDPTTSAPTEIILPVSSFPRGYNVQVTPAGSLLSFARDERTLALFTSGSLTSPTTVSVVITPK